MQAVIIDDEPHAHKVLQALLDQSDRKVSVVSSAFNVHDGIKELKNHDPDIAFVDIRMPDGSGFDLLEKVKGIRTKVIFTTAYDEYALKAFKYNALDYLLKPIDPEELERALTKATGISDNYNLDRRVSSILNDFRKSGTKRIAVTSHNEIQYLDIENISYLKSDGNYTILYLRDNEEILIPKTLKEYAEILPKNLFFRVHQSYIIHAVTVRKFKKDKNTVVLENGESIPVSRRKKNDLLDWLDGF